MNKIAPRRRLPWDVLLLVFKEADPSTLAVLGRVSRDFLTATSPELYRDVVVTSVKQLEGLFCERKVVQAGRKTKNSSKTSRINPHLSLSQIRTLIVDFASLSSHVPKALSISSSRLDDERPIPLERLEISLNYSKKEMLPLLYSSLFGNLNPKRCSFQVVNRPFYGHHWLEIRDGSSLLGWSRIQKMDIIGVVLFTRSPTSLLAGVPPSSSGQAQVVRLYVSTLLSWNCADPTSLVDEIGNYSFFDGLEFMQDRSFVLVVRSEEEKTEVEAAVRTSQKIARWRHVFAVELET